MFHITRVDFPDVLWGQDELDDVARLWQAWHDQSRLLAIQAMPSYQRVRLRLWGVPAPECDRFMAKLEERLATAGHADHVHLDDEGYLTVVSPWETASQPCALGWWLEMVNDRAFDGLVLRLELSIHDWPALPEGPAAAGGTLVLCGQLRKNGFLLKAVWPVGLEPGLENLYRMTVWPYEDAFLAALESFRAGMVTGPPERYFAGRATQRWSTVFAKLIIHVPGPASPRQGRLPSFLFRAGVHLSGLIAVLLVQYLTPDWPAKAAVMACLATAFIGLLAFVVIWEARRVGAFYWRMKAAMKRIYTRPLEYRDVDLAEYHLDTDANAKKFSRELEALGCRHMGDIQHVRETAAESVVRIFVLPEERTYVCLMLMVSTGKFHKFPAHAFFLIQTRLADGRVITINEGGGYRKSLIPNVFSRRFPDIHDPEILLAKHRKFVAEICARGHTLAPLDDLPALLRHNAEDHEQHRPVMEKWGYFSWPAAFRQAFELVRKEYLEPAD